MPLLIRGALAALAVTALAVPACAESVRNDHPWTFQVHNSTVAVARSSLMWQAERGAAATGGAATQGAQAASGAGGLPGVGSIGNMNVITVIVGEGGSAEVTVDADQQNLGDQGATAVSAVGDTVHVTPAGPS